MALHILLTAATRTMRPEHLAGLDSFISTPHQSYCYDLVSDWMQSDCDSLYQIARFAEEEARLDTRFMNLTVEDLADTECFPCINECIFTVIDERKSATISLTWIRIRSVVENAVLCLV